MNSAQLLPLIRDLFSRHPDMHNLAPWEMQSALFVLGYTHDLAPEAEIAAAIQVAKSDRLADLDQLLRARFGAEVVARGLAVELSRRQGARGRAKSLPETAIEEPKGAA